MPLMKGKIKNLFQFVGRAWSGGSHGLIGIITSIFGIFLIIRLFVGTVSFQNLVVNQWHLHNERAELELETSELDALNRHLELLNNGPSPDYTSEMGLRYLNIGDSKYKILRY